MKPLAVAVVGAGRFGGLHARKLTELPNVRVAAIVDRNIDAARSLAHTLPHAVPIQDAAQLPPGVDAATVAVSLESLAPVSMALLERGCHVLVEKPGATTASQARRMVAAARRRQRVLAVGFVERFNPVIEQARWPARHLVARRSGPPGALGGPLPLDWLVHDLDLARHLMSPTDRRIKLELVNALSTDDEVWVELVGTGGRRARLTASRRAHRVRRRVWIDGHRLDLLAWPSLTGRRKRSDPLTQQLEQFVGAALGKTPQRLARGEDAVAVLELTDAIAAMAHDRAA